MGVSFAKQISQDRPPVYELHRGVKLRSALGWLFRVNNATSPWPLTVCQPAPDGKDGTSHGNAWRATGGLLGW